MKSLSDFTEYIRPEVPGYPISKIEQYLMEAIQEFCEDSWILNFDFTADIETADIDTANNNSVSINISGTSDSSSVFPITFPATFGGTTSTTSTYRPIAIASWRVDDVDEQLVYLKSGVHNKYITGYTTRYFYFDSNTHIVVFPFLGSATVWGNVIYKPLKSVTEVDDIFFEDHLDPILANTKYRLFKMPNFPWSNLLAAKDEYMNYRRLLGKVRKRLGQDFQRTAKQVYWREFGA